MKRNQIWFLFKFVSVDTPLFKMATTVDYEVTFLQMATENSYILDKKSDYKFDDFVDKSINSAVTK